LTDGLQPFEYPVGFPGDALDQFAAGGDILYQSCALTDSDRIGLQVAEEEGLDGPVALNIDF
jgi:hypothetical protein